MNAENWQVVSLADEKTIHLIPNNDGEIHTQSASCKCVPIIKFENGWMIVAHDAFDGRLGVEWANEILGNL